MTVTLPAPAPPHAPDLLARLRDLPLYRALPDPAGTPWADVPFLTREDLTGAFTRGELRHPAATRAYLTPHPGGHWLPEYATPADLLGHARAGARALALAGVTGGVTAQVAFGFHRFAGGWLFQGPLEELGACVIPFGPGETDAQLDTIRRLGVGVLACAPSFAQRLGEAGARVPLLLASGEPLSSIAGRRERVQAALSGDGVTCRAADVYASSEAGLMAAETTDPALGLRVLDDWVFLEVIDPETGAALPDGERGELVITHLTREAMPLLRFRTGDLTRLERRADGTFLPGGVFGNVGGMLKVKGVKLYPREVAFWLAGHGLDHTRHTLRVWSPGGADRVGVTAAPLPGVNTPDLEALRVDFQRRFAFRLDDLTVDATHEGPGVQDERH